MTRMLNRENDSLKRMSRQMCYFGADGTAAMPALMPTPELVRFGGEEYHVVIIHRPGDFRRRARLRQGRLGQAGGV
jgi:hypothetical protein